MLNLLYAYYFTGEIAMYLSGELEAICLSHSEVVTEVSRKTEGRENRKASVLSSESM